MVRLLLGRKYTVYSREFGIIGTGELIKYFPRHIPLSETEVLRYFFNGDEEAMRSSVHTERIRHAKPFDRAVFKDLSGDHFIVPVNSQHEFVSVFDDVDEE
mgnify:CR=1 FL=1